MSSAIAFEGLNNAAEQGGNLIIVVNDNEMSIAEDFGGMYGNLARLRASNGTAELNLFKAFGLDYRYVEQGNDVDTLVAALEDLKDIDHPVVLHIHTTKGLGFSDETEAQDGSDGCNQTNPQPHAGQCEANHWQDPDSALGKPLDARKYYGQMAMASLESRFENEPGLVVISPPPLVRMASPVISVNVPDRIMWTPALPRSMRPRSPQASRRLEAGRFWRLPPRSSSVFTTSCSRSWR